MTNAASAEAFFAPSGVTGGFAAAPWLDERRARAIAAFRARGIPNRRVEDWKYSDLKSALDAANDFDVSTLAWTVSPCPAGVELLDLSTLADAPDWIRNHFGKSAADAAMPAASLAFARSGFALRVERDFRADEVLRLQFHGSGHAHALIVLEDGARLTLAETPSDGGFSNVGIEIVIGSNAQMTLVRTAEAAPSSIQIEDVAARVARDGVIHAHLVNGGASFSRLNLRIMLKERGASARFSGASVLGEARHADVTTEIYHAVGKTTSTQLFKHVVGARAHAVYQGKITVAEGANGSDSRQTAKAILLSDRAEADLKPELEILADDVKCAHGAAVGDLDEDSLFYLRSRGLSELEARDLLIRAFLEDAIVPISDDEIRQSAWHLIEDLLARVEEDG